MGTFRNWMAIHHFPLQLAINGHEWWVNLPFSHFLHPKKNHRQLEQLQSLLPLSSVDPELAQRTASALAPRLVDATGQMPEATKASFEAVGLARVWPSGWGFFG